MTPTSTVDRRAFLSQLGGGVLLASLGVGLSQNLGFAMPSALDDEALEMGRFAPWVDLMCETAPGDLLPKVMELINRGVSLSDLVAAGALANARAFGGEDYVGYHAYMALMPAYQIAKELPAKQAPLPIMKVLYRNTARIRGYGGHKRSTLRAQPASFGGNARVDAQHLISRVNAEDLGGAEAAFDSLVRADPRGAMEALIPTINQEVDVHRVVLAWRAWDLLQLTGMDHARILLRQSLRQCVDRESSMRRPQPVRQDMPKVLADTGVLEKPLGDRRMTDEWIEKFAIELANARRIDGALSTANALSEGISPSDIAEAHSLACTHLMLRQRARTKGSAGKPVGSVHGACTGVHSSDTAAAWRGIALVGSDRQKKLALVSGAYHAAGQSGGVAAKFFAYGDSIDELRERKPNELLGILRECVTAKDQAGAAAAATCFVTSHGRLADMFDVLRANSIASDGALHAEKYYRTQKEVIDGDRPAFRATHAAALARVCASQQGIPADGMEQARSLIG